MNIIFFLICLIASTAGAVAGFGGGVIIKPVLDLFALLPVATTSFLSGCTVLSMSVCSLIRTRKSPVKLDFRVSTPLALGAAGGGLLGKWLLELVRTGFESQNTLGAIQSVCLTIITIFVFIYICQKDNLPFLHIQSIAVTVVIGITLGVISSFLGIGGGTSNVAVLFFFFSMDAKTAAKNSIYIIMFSQIASIMSSILGRTVPLFQWTVLALMAAGGIGGALIGAAVSKKINSHHVELLLKILLLIIICVDFYNTFRFFSAV